MKLIILFLIRFYQRFLSPIKGYSCAYRAYTGHDSCSAYGYRVIERYGVITGYHLTQRRMDKCSDIYEARTSHLKQIRSISKYQTGHCDVPDIGCDSIDLSDVCDIADCITSPFQYMDNCNSCSTKRKEKPTTAMKYKPLPKKI